MVNLYREKLISRPTILEELRRGGVLDPDLRIDAELERIEEDRKRRQDEEVEDAEAMANVTTPAAPRQQTDQVEDLNRAAQDQQNDKEGTTAEINR
jgi:hypothetical protein